MIILVCLPCSSGFRVKGPVEEIDTLIGPSSDLWPDGFTCPHCTKSMQGYLEAEVAEAVYKALQIRDLSPVEAFSTFCGGVGLPEDRDCRKEVIEGLLREHPIRRIAGQEVPNTGRYHVDFLELWDGTRLYFGASGHGAIIYRVTRERAPGG